MSIPNKINNGVESPFEIQEIVEHIASYFNPGSLRSCILVSKSWHQVFLPFLWKEIYFMGTKHDPNAKKKTILPYDEETIAMKIIFSKMESNEILSFIKDSSEPRMTVSALYKHSHLIRLLSISKEMPVIVPNIEFNSLRTLSLQGACAMECIRSPVLLSNNPTIKDLSLRCEGYIMPDSHINFWEVLSNLKNLKSISLKNVVIPQKAAGPFWKTLSHLERAVFYGGRFPDELPLTSTPLQKLRHLTVANITNLIDATKSFEGCTNLESFCWKSSFNVGVGTRTEYIVEKLKDSMWPNLHQIELTCLKLSNIQTQQILDSVSGLTVFSLDYADWKIESFDALTRHFGTLEILEIWEDEVDYSFTSLMANTVMCSCPNLKEFKAPIIRGIDIVNNNVVGGMEHLDQGWICVNLRKLSLPIDLNGLDSQIPLLEKLATLTQLRVLGTRVYSKKLRTISFTLDQGLAILKPLKSLHLVHISGDSNNMTVADIEWIIKNWKNLSYLEGLPHQDLVQSQSLYNILIRHNIKIRS